MYYDLFHRITYTLNSLRKNGKSESDINKMKPRIRNVVATANLEQHVEIQKLVNFGWGIYDSAIYRGVCGYVKSPEMSGRVAVFASGKMISIGSKSVEESVQQLYNAKFYLMQARLISDATLQPKIQNIVAT
ncbi:MAG: hypothetical protein KGL95_12740, partial [Patescibacteria group bacterium]|nr:hypothetical protein [Patescibacteria group bacterium]